MATTNRIEQLAREAAEHGDIEMSAIARYAVTGDRESYAGHNLTPREQTRVDAMTRDEAIEECKRILADADT